MQAARSGSAPTSNVLIDAAAELRQLEYAQRLKDRARNRMSREGCSTGRVLFEAAVAGGTQALDAGPAGLKPGAVADIVALAPGHVALDGRKGDRILDNWIFSARTPAIDAVYVRGVKRVEGGRHYRRDEIRARFQKTMQRLLV